MRPAVALLALLAALAAGLWALFDATDMTVDRTYATLADARANGGAVAHGWLPDLLLASSYDIRTINDLDHGGSQGHFCFNPEDAPVLLRNFRSGVPDTSRYANWKDLVAKERHEGKTLLRHQAGGDTWVFFCDLAKGRCEYLMW